MALYHTRFVCIYLSSFSPSQVLDKYQPPDYYLPESYTCFFLLKVPRYSCKPVLEEKLRYAINFCKSIDTDDYARVNLQVSVDHLSFRDIFPLRSEMCPLRNLLYMGFCPLAPIDVILSPFAPVCLP